MALPKKQKKELHEYPVFSVGTELHGHIGMESVRRNNVECLDNDTLLSSAGNTILYVSLKTGKITADQGPEGGGIGATCVHPEKALYVICEKGSDPLVRVHEWPSKRRLHVMKKGAVQGFSACSFNAKGNLLATVAIEPDFVITVWDWQQEAIVLRNKAFGSDVFNVTFNSFNDGLLVTSGLGHIKFWTMATTFTGLKLQGEVGKFGRLDLSDVCSSVCLPDGKVVSGCESGSLLLWEGSLVKCQLFNKTATDEKQRIADEAAEQNADSSEENKVAEAVPFVTCHDGPIEVLRMIAGGKIIMSAGHDGYLRYWSADEIDASENDGTSITCGVRLLKEYFVGSEIAINGATLTPNKEHWVLQNAHGSIVKAPYWSYEVVMSSAPAPAYKADPPIVSFSAGPLHHVLASPKEHTAITLGEDGSLRLIDYIKSKELYHVKFNSAALKATFLSMETGDKDGRTFIAAFHDGTVRVLRKCQNTFELISQCRPHVDPIIDMSIDRSNKHVLTVSADGTAFYMKLRPLEFTLEPIGFCRLPSKATSACWTVEGTSCLIGFDNGTIIALNPPKPGEVDTTVSYEWTPTWSGIGYRQKKKPPEKPKKENDAAVDDEDEDEPDELDDEEDQGPWPVNFISLTPNNTYVVGLDKAELCYDYECKIRYDGREGPTPLPATGIEPPNWVEEPILNHAFRDTVTIDCNTSHSGKYYIVVCESNRLLIRRYEKPENIVHSTQVHDGIHGRTTGATLSFDDKLIITSATDGMLFTEKLIDGEAPSPGDAANLQNLPVAKPPTAEAAVARSVEDQKKHEDECRAEEAAQGKQAQTLRRIRTIHEEFETVLHSNAEKQGGQRVSEQEMQLDPKLYTLLEDEKQKRVDEAAIEYSWETAKREVTLKKLRDTFVDSLQYDHFAVLGFANDVKVGSFRTAHFTEHQKKALEAIQELLQRADEAEDDDMSSQHGSMSPSSPAMSSNTRGSPQGSPKGKRQGDFPIEPNSPTTEHKDPDLTTSLLGVSKKDGKSSNIKSQLEKAEERKRERIERRKGHQQLLSRRPRQQDDDPKFLQEIMRAEKFMGDFILKTSAEYTIPEHSRPTADRKTKQLILLEHSIVQLRSEFNQRLLAMRDLKGRLCEQINKDRSRIKDISAQLHQEQDFLLSALVAEELPEHRFDCTREDLEKFEKDQARAKKREEAMLRAKKGFGGDLASGNAEEEDEEGHTPMQSKPSMRAPQRRQSQMTNLRERTDNDIKTRVEAVKRTDLEEEEAGALREQLLFERERLERRVAKTITAFDDSLMELFNEKLKLEADLTMADMRVLLLFREFQLLSEFKKKDEELQRRLDAKKKERQEVLDRREAVHQRRAAKLGDLKALNADMELLLAEYTDLISTVPDAKVPLDKIYNKRIKRRRKDADEESDDDDLSSSDDDEEEIDEDVDADDGVEEICPPNCDEDTYQQVLALRERRLDQDEIFAEHNKAEELAKKDLAQLKQKEEKLSNEVRGVEKEVEQFQNEKQRQLNLLTTIVVLKLSQVQCLRSDGKLPHTYGDSIVVFTQSGLEALRRRIIELAEQKIAKRKETDSLVHERARVLRKKSKKQADHSDWEAKVYEVQLLKFGQRVDLEMLENVAVDRETEELKARLKLEEVKWEKELQKQTAKLTGLRQDQQARITDNTVLLKDLGSLRAEQHDVEERLGQSTQKVVAKMSGGSRVATAADRTHLKDLVVAQQQEIDALKNEIAMLRRKGGHVYTPVVNNTAGMANTF